MSPHSQRVSNSVTTQLPEAPSGASHEEQLSKQPYLPLQMAAISHRFEAGPAQMSMCILGQCDAQALHSAAPLGKHIKRMHSSISMWHGRRTSRAGPALLLAAPPPQMPAHRTRQIRHLQILRSSSVRPCVAGLLIAQCVDQPAAGVLLLHSSTAQAQEGAGRTGS